MPIGKRKRTGSELGEGVLRQVRICTCGICRTCLDNAKWERIWKDHKKEDPTYYASSGLKRSSPLS